MTGTVEHSSSIQTYSGSNSIYLDGYGNNEYITFSTSSFITYEENEIKLNAYVEAGNTNKTIFSLKMLHTSSGVGNSIDINNYMDFTVSGSWQNVTIPLNDFYSPDSLSFTGSIIDSIQLVIDITTGTPPEILFNTLQITSSASSVLTPFTSSFTSSITSSSEQHKYEYSVYNPLINNISASRENKFKQIVDYSYDFKTPINLERIKLDLAEKAQVPESNYTATRVINPRYEGTKVHSLTYNEYTPSGIVEPDTTIIFGLNRPNIANSFLNGDTGSWEGDESYGRNSIIDSRPTYFAHFASSHDNFNIWGLYTYTLDQLILIPDEDIRGIQGYEPITLQLENNRDNKLLVSSTFKR